MCAALSPMMKSSHLSECWWNCFDMNQPVWASIICACLWLKWVFPCLFLGMTPGGWCSSCERVESLKRFVSVHRAIRPGDSLWHRSISAKTKSSYAHVVMIDVFLVTRWTYNEFYSRYSILMSHQEADLHDKKQTCRHVLQRLIQVSRLFDCLLLQHCYALLCTACWCIPLALWLDL